MQPWMGGGEMIQDVFLDHSTYADPPSRCVCAGRVVSAVAVTRFCLWLWEGESPTTAGALSPGSLRLEATVPVVCLAMWYLCTNCHFKVGCMLRRFEAGTPAIAEAVGFGAACDYLTALGMDKVAAYEKQLGTYLYEQVRSIGARAHGRER